MPEILRNTFDGFPTGELVFRQTNEEFRDFVLDSTAAIIEGTPTTPESLRETYHLQLDVPTDIVDPRSPTKSTLKLQLILPITKSEYDQLYAPEIDEIVIDPPDATIPVAKSEPSIPSTSILAIFLKEREKESIDEDGEDAKEAKEPDVMAKPHELRAIHNNADD